MISEGSELKGVELLNFYPEDIIPLEVCLIPSSCIYINIYIYIYNIQLGLLRAIRAIKMNNGGCVLCLCGSYVS